MPLRERLRRLPAEIGYRRGPWVASWLRKRWTLLRNPHATVRFGPGTYLGPGFSLHIPDDGTFIVGDGCEFRRDFRCEIHGSGRVTIGNRCHFTYGVVIQCTTSIEIGDRCMFGQSSLVVDGQHRFRDITKPMLEQGYDFQPLKIEDDVTTTTKNTIMHHIGERAFIGANAVVTKPIPPFVVAVGAPARPVDYFGPPGQEPAGLSAARDGDQ
jgi:acetyltransferase-like isoleucine patch superfamily enzyme